MLIAEYFIGSLVRWYGKHSVSIDSGTWHPQACRFLKLNHHIHSAYEKSMIKESSSILRIELKVLMTIFPVGRNRHIMNLLTHIIIEYRFTVLYEQSPTAGVKT